MPRALKVCSATDCAELVPSGRCDACRRRAEQKRGSAAARGYDARWVRRSAAYLRRHPFCVLRLPGCTLLATEADHYPVDKRTLLAQGVPDPDADHRLRALCHHCHSLETARLQPGGWHAWT